MKSPFPLILGCNRQNIRPIQKLFSRSSYATSTTYQPHSYDISRIRNIGISAHIDSGKTTLTERILFYTGRIHTIHEVRGRDGVGAKMDSMELEREKGITIQSAATYAWWRGEWQINLIDTPGHVDFTIEVERALRVLDAAVMVVCAVSGVQSQTITVDRQMKRYNIPRLGFINKLDRAGAAPWKCIEKIRGKLGIRCAALQVPLALEDSVEEEGGPLVDLVQMKGWKFDGEHGERMIPFELQSQDSKTMQLIRDKRRELIETLADIDEPLFNAYLENEDYVTTTLLRQAIRRTTLSRQFMPIFMGSAYKNSGVQLLLDGVADYLPNPYEVENWALDKHNERHLLSSDPTNSLVCLAFKLEDGKYGQLTYIRVYQGSLTKGSIVLNARTGKRLKVPRLVRMHSSEMEDVDVLKAGEIGAMFGVECSSGDTFTDGTLELSMTPMHVPDPVISLAVNPVSLTQDGPAFAKALQKFQKEDPTLRVHLDTESNQTIISGMGELHLEIYLERMRREYRCNCIIGKPQVAYRETITRKASFDYQHKKQTGGAGQYARVIGYIEPVTLLTDTPDIQPKQILSEDSNGNQFVNQVYGGTVPTCYIPACDKGFGEVVAKGPLIAHQVTKTRMVLLDGAAHVVDSNEHSFRYATMQGFKQAYQAANPVILEPIMKVMITSPVENQGDVMSTVTKKRGTITDTESTTDGTTLCITAEVPLAEMFGYSTELRSLTQGKGEFTMEYVEHRHVPPNIQAQLVATKSQEGIQNKAFLKN